MIDEMDKRIEFWLTQAEAADPNREKLRPLYTAWKAKKYSVVVFVSGAEDLTQLTGQLLVSNRLRMAEHEAKAAKQ